MSDKQILSGTIHKMPRDLRTSIGSDIVALAAWNKLTPLARNEWICWVVSVKKDETRKEHITRLVSEVKEGLGAN